MNSFPQHSNPAAEEQASLWAAKLDGSLMSATDRSALDEWLAERPDHRALLSRYCQFSADLEQQMPLIEGIRELSAETRKTTATARSFPWLRWPMMAGAALTAAAAVALGFWLLRPQQQFKNIATPAAQRQSLTLVDGTRIELNAQTSVQIEINGKDRRVRLASGEAFFSVHKDPSRPFTVETPTGSVRVTGTKFAVTTESAGVLEVTVLEGSVKTSPGELTGQSTAPVMLNAGDHLVASPTGLVQQKLSASELIDTLAWRQGQIVFKGTPLRDVLAKFARYHGRGITASDEVASLPIGARFSLDDLDGFFDALEAALPVKVTKNSNGTVRVSRRSDP
ncbi:MAG: FecR domain-containing protein [Lacunisphaera sp.]